jgi:hypothetical protein
MPLPSDNHASLSDNHAWSEDSEKIRDSHEQEDEVDNYEDEDEVDLDAEAPTALYQYKVQLKHIYPVIW